MLLKIIRAIRSRGKFAVLAFPLTLVVGVWVSGLSLFPIFIPANLPPFADGGPIGCVSQLEAEASNGDLTVKVYRQRIPGHSCFLGAEMHALIYNRQGRLISDKMIGSDGMWSELDNAYKNIEFDHDAIRLRELWGRTYVIQLSELQF